MCVFGRVAVWPLRCLFLQFYSNFIRFVVAPLGSVGGASFDQNRAVLLPLADFSSTFWVFVGFWTHVQVALAFFHDFRFQSTRRPFAPVRCRVLLRVVVVMPNFVKIISCEVLMVFADVFCLRWRSLFAIVTALFLPVFSFYRFHL